MLVKFVLLKRRIGLSHDQFSRYWRDKHPHALLAAGHDKYNRAYLQNHRFDVPGLHSVDDLDGIPQMLQFDGSDTPRLIQDDPLYETIVVPDEEVFIDRASACILLAKMTTGAVPLPASTIKLLFLLKGDSTGERRKLSEHLGRVRRELSRQPSCLYSNQLSLREHKVFADSSRSLKDDGNPTINNCYGIAEIFFPDELALTAAVADPAFTRLMSDVYEANGMLPNVLAVREKLIYGRRW